MTHNDEERERTKLERKALKRELKHQRSSKANDPAHQLSKLEMIKRTTSVAQTQEAARIAEKRRVYEMRERHQRWMRGRFLEELDSEGETV